MLLGDPTKAQRVLGWKAEVDFPSLVKMMVDHDLDMARREQLAQGYRAIPDPAGRVGALHIFRRSGARASSMKSPR